MRWVLGKRDRANVFKSGQRGSFALPRSVGQRCRAALIFHCDINHALWSLSFLMREPWEKGCTLTWLNSRISGNITRTHLINKEQALGADFWRAVGPDRSGLLLSHPDLSGLWPCSFVAPCQV